MDQLEHVPVLFSEVLEYLQPRPGGAYIDGTLGAGGHTEGILRLSAPDGRVLVFDRDPEAIAYSRKRLQAYGDRLTFVNASYAEMNKVAPRFGFGAVGGILLDLGLSSRQLDSAARGFSFQKDGPLDMRFDPALETTAASIVNEMDEAELALLLRRYGEVPRSGYVARLIVENRPLTTTTELADLLARKLPRRGRIHPATQVFQALRIAVNDELGELEQGLTAALETLAPGGRLAVISFHSLEDRLVKQTFREWARDCICPPQQPICTCDKQAVTRQVTRGAVKASDEEIAANPRSRSARLRVVEKL
ncbi:MAG: 16S rRNA (cytosine(1402)-N(4))-methyltransferase RsmH [Candidatus Promineifilaceae bacterium]